MVIASAATDTGETARMLHQAKPTDCRVGIDIGGTFTDLVVVNSKGETFTRKVSSTVDNYARAIIEGLAGILELAGAWSPRYWRVLAWHDGRLKRHFGAQRRPDRPYHDEGVPRYSGDPQSPNATALRSEVG